MSTGTRRSRSPVVRGIALAVALAAVAALLVAALAPSSTPALRVYGASSLRDAFPALDGDPTDDFGGSDQLQVQIERGAAGGARDHQPCGGRPKPKRFSVACPAPERTRSMKSCAARAFAPERRTMQIS